jgi:hypothetical protein
VGIDGYREGPGRKPIRFIKQWQTEMSLSPLVEKLGIKPGMRMLIVAAPGRYLKMLAPLPDGVQIASADDGPFAFVQLFVADASDLNVRAPELLTKTGENALIWVTYPKMSSKLASELSRDKVRAMLSNLGWRAVAIVAIDEVWSALRFRPIAESPKGSRGRNRLHGSMTE